MTFYTNPTLMYKNAYHKQHQECVSLCGEVTGAEGSVREIHKMADSWKITAIQNIDGIGSENILRSMLQEYVNGRVLLDI